MLSAKIEGTELETTIASLKLHGLAADIIPDHQVDIGNDGEVIDLASHAGKVELHQKVCTIVHLRDDTGQIHTTFEVDHQWFDGKRWQYRTADEVVAQIKSNLDTLLAKADRPLRNPGEALLVDAITERSAKLAQAAPSEPAP